MSDFLSLTEMIFSTFTGIFDFLFLPVSTFLTRYSSNFSEFLLEILEFTGLTSFLGEISLGGLLLGTLLPFILVILIIYFFIP